MEYMSDRVAAATGMIAIITGLLIIAFGIAVVARVGWAAAVLPFGIAASTRRWVRVGRRRV